MNWSFVVVNFHLWQYKWFKKTIMSPLLKQYTEVMKLPFNLIFWLISISPDIRQRGCFFFLLFFCKSVRVHGFVTFVIVLQFGSCQLSQLFTIDCKTCCVQIRRLQCVLRPVWEERWMFWCYFYLMIQYEINDLYC